MILNVKTVPQLLITLLIIYFNVFLASTAVIPVFNGFQIYDLETNYALHFLQEAQTWSLSTPYQTNSKVTFCEGFPLLAGYEALASGGTISKQYLNIPQHNIVYWSITFAVLDNWQNSDYFQLQFDGQGITSDYMSQYSGYFYPSSCGSQDWNDLPFYSRVGRHNHTSSSLTLTAISNIASTPDIASFGIHNVSLVFMNATQEPDYTCFRLQSNIIFGLAGECPCPKGRYLSSPTFTGLCTQQNCPDYVCPYCNISCNDCFGPSSSQCFACANGFSSVSSVCIECSQNCKTCSGPAENQCITCQEPYWLHWNGTCLPNCNYSTINQDQVDDFRECLYPCTTSDYLVEWISTCSSTCSWPLVGQTINTHKVCVDRCTEQAKFLRANNSCTIYCEAPYVHVAEEGVNKCIDTTCPLILPFLYWNRTCLGVCDIPFVQRQDASLVMHCDFPCNNSNADILLYDGTCSAQCDFPYQVKTNNIAKFCVSQCASNSSYAYTNGSCLQNCNYPRVAKIVGAVLVCDHPCKNSNSYFNPSKGQCQTQCKSPYKLGEVKEDVAFCIPDFTDEQKNQAQHANSIASSSGDVASAGAIASNAALGPSAMSLASVAKMLYYIKYMHINFPPKLQLLLDMQDSSPISINFDFGMPQSVDDFFPNYPVPGKFDAYDEPSSFIVNTWQTLLSLTIILIIIALTSYLSFVLKNVSKVQVIHKIATQIRNFARWDLFLIVLISNFEGFALFSSLEFRGVHPDSPGSMVSFFVCVIMNAVAIFLIIKTLYIVYDLHKIKNKTFDASAVPDAHQKKKWTSWRVLFQHFKDDSFFKHCFMVFFLVRIYVFDLTIGYLFDYPLTQAFILMFSSVFMMGYIIIKRPFKSKYHGLEVCVNEAILTVVNIHVLIIGILDSAENSNGQAVREYAGEVIILCNVLFNIFGALLMITELILTLIKVYRVLKKTKGYEGSIVKMIISLFRRNLAEVELERDPELETKLEREEKLDLKKIRDQEETQEKPFAKDVTEKGSLSDNEIGQSYKLRRARPSLDRKTYIAQETDLPSVVLSPQHQHESKPSAHKLSPQNSIRLSKDFSPNKLASLNLGNQSHFDSFRRLGDIKRNSPTKELESFSHVIGSGGFDLDSYSLTSLMNRRQKPLGQSIKKIAPQEESATHDSYTQKHVKVPSLKDIYFREGDNSRANKTIKKANSPQGKKGKNGKTLTEVYLR